jgi:hypothetical protein
MVDMNSGNFLPLESHRGAKIENKTVYVSKRDMSVIKQQLPTKSEYGEKILMEHFIRRIQRKVTTMCLRNPFSYKILNLMS